MKCLFYESSMKKTLIQVMGAAMVSQIKPEYIITLIVQIFCCRQYVA
jgi:hypothetical protein